MPRSSNTSRESRLQQPFPRMTYAEAMERFGIDKPDLRFGMEVKDATAVVRKTEFQVFQQAEAVRGLCVKGVGREVQPQEPRRTDGVRQGVRRQGTGVAEGRRRQAQRPVGEVLHAGTDGRTSRGDGRRSRRPAAVRRGQREATARAAAPVCGIGSARS